MRRLHLSALLATLMLPIAFAGQASAQEAREDRAALTEASSTAAALTDLATDDCGFCDGLCVDGLCIMDLDGLLSVEGIDELQSADCGFCDGICVDGMCIMDLGGVCEALVEPVCGDGVDGGGEVQESVDPPQDKIQALIRAVEQAEREGPCGFCDGVCVDGKCLMDVPD